MQDPLRAPFLKLVETSINAALRTDPPTCARLGAFAGRSLQVEVSDLPMMLALDITEDGIRVNAPGDAAPELTLRGPSVLFLQLAARPGDRSLLFGGRLQVEGDTELAGDIADCLADLHLDGEALIAPVVGDVAAHGIGQFLGTAAGWMQRSARHLWLDLEEYLENESDLPTAGEARALFEAIEDTRDAVDRLTQRLERLRAGLHTGAEKP